MQDKTKCNHEYFINEDKQSECKHCGLLESTIKAHYPDNNMNYIDKVLEELDVKYNFYFGNDCFPPIKDFIKQSFLTIQEQHEAEIKELKNKKYKEMLIEYMNDMHAIDENDALQQLAYEKGRHIAGEQHKKELEELRDSIFNIDFYNDKEREKIRDKFNKHINSK